MMTFRRDMHMDSSTAHAIGNEMLRTESTIIKQEAYSKVAIYKWLIRDLPGRFQMIDKTLLQIDGGETGYQRDAKSAKAGTMARDWSWIACGCLIVVCRPDGAFFVVDGQHRLCAAMKRSDIRELPCLVFELDSQRDEARAFIEVNVNRKPLGTLDRYRALVMQQHPAALAAGAFADLAGRTVRAGADAHSIECVGAVMRCWEDDSGSFDQITQLIIKLCRGRHMHSDIIEGLFYVERKMNASGASLSDPFWSQRVLSSGCDALLERSRRMREALGKGGSAVIGRGFAAVISARLRKPMPGFPEDAA